MSKESIELALSVLKAEKPNLSPGQREQLAELSKAGEDVREDVTDTLETTEKRELTPKQADSLVSTLKTRFETPKNEKLREMVVFADVEKSLRASPENMYALHKLEETGGEPQVIGLDADEFVFEDRSAESPSGRRDLDFDQSLAQAKEFGVDMQSPDSYKVMQEDGEYDLNSGSWLKTDSEDRKRTGDAIRGNRREGGVSVGEHNAVILNPYYGWRASLRVKKV